MKYISVTKSDMYLMIAWVGIFSNEVIKHISVNGKSSLFISIVVLIALIVSITLGFQERKLIKLERELDELDRDRRLLELEKLRREVITTETEEE